VTACQFDVTRDEVLNYTRLLIQAGMPCDLQHYPERTVGSLPAARVHGYS